MLSKSFGVDHYKLNKGLYLSQEDHLNDTTTLTMDIRMRKPYVDDILSNIEAHTLEHSLATAVREYIDEEKNTHGKTEILPIYIGPMGCATGFYIVLQLSDKLYSNKDYYPIISEILLGAIHKIYKMKEVPAKDKKRCGNANTLGEISIAHSLSKELEDIVLKTKESNVFDEYPMIEY